MEAIGRKLEEVASNMMIHMDKMERIIAQNRHIAHYML